jgi:hypothetical protein
MHRQSWIIAVAFFNYMLDVLIPQSKEGDAMKDYS